MVMRRVIVVASKYQLSNLVATFNSPSRFPHLLYSGQQHSNQNSNDCDDYQQLD
jgi:hypothetical protein